jgi:hypothetical protein
MLGISCSLFAKPINMVYLIPQGFTGGVIIVYDDIIGVEPEIDEAGSIFYRIPKDGILVVKPTKKEGPYKLSYFYVGDKDTRTEIEYLDSKNNAKDRGNIKPRNQDEVTEDERDNGIFAMNHRRITFKILNKSSLSYAFTVGHPKDANSIYTDIDWRLDDLEKYLSKKKLDFVVKN